MADEKKVIPESEKPDKAAAPEQLTLDKDGTPPFEKAAPAKTEVHTQKPSVENKVSVPPENKEPIKPVFLEKPKEQAPTIPGKVVDCSTAQKETGKPALTEKKEAPQTPEKRWNRSRQRQSLTGAARPRLTRCPRQG